MPDTAIYARISEDMLGTEKGVTRQLEDARALVAASGWELVGEYVDNDVSALTGGAKRTAYMRLMDECRAGRVKRIVVWQTSRFWRNRTERSAAIDELGKLQLSLVAVKGPSLDLATASGRMLAGLLGEFDSMESEVKGERQVRAALQRAQSGRMAAFVPYGWRREYETSDSGRIISFADFENPVEADILREIVDRLLAGQSMLAIITDLNARGVPTPRRKPGFVWSYAGLKSVVLRPSNVALRVHHGKVFGAAAFPALVDRDKWDRVVALLTAPERHQHRDGARHHLLTFGVGECGVCGGVLNRRTAPNRKGERLGYYRCEKGCVQRDQVKVDQLVADVVIEWLARPDAHRAFDHDEDAGMGARERAAAVRARLDLAADQYADGAIDASQLARITARLRPDLAAAEAEAMSFRTHALPAQVEDLYGSEAGETWAKGAVTWKRAVLEAMEMKVRIMPQRNHQFDASLVQITAR